MGFSIVEGNPFDDRPEEQKPGMLSRLARGARDLVTGEDRTEFPAAPEFFDAYSQSRGTGGELPELGSKDRSAITPDPEAQFDILSKSIPNLQRTTDKFGNMMLKAPGMQDFAYLNKPGASARDLDEIGTQTLATLPLMGWMGRAGSLVGSAGRGLIGGAAASLGQDVGAIAQGSEQGVDPNRAVLSGAVGAAAPLVVPLVGGVAGTVAGGAKKMGSAYTRMTQPREYARRQVQGAFDEDFAAGGGSNLSAAERATADARKQDLRAMDYGGGTVQDLARKAANISGAARDTIMRVVGPRWKTQTERVGRLFEDELGFDRSVKEVGEQLKTKARQARQPLYDQAYRAGAGGVDSPALQQMATSPLFARAMQRARATMQDRAAVPGLFTTGMRGKNGYTLEYWDQVKQRLDDMHGAAQRSGQNAKALDIDRMRRALRDNLDAVVPQYRGARSAAETYFDAGDALDAGKKFATEKFDLRDAAHAINTLNPAEKSLFQESFARTKMNELRAVPDRSNVLNRINASELDRERMKLGLGSGGYSQLEGFLRVEQMMEAMRQAMGNSTSVRQWVQLGREYGLPMLMELGAAGLHEPRAALAGLAMAGFKLIDQKIDANVAKHVANLLVSKDPDMFLSGLKQVSKPGWLEALRAIDNAISAAGIYKAMPVAQQQVVNQTSNRGTEQQDERTREAFDKARAAIDQGADRNAVMQRLLKSGINPRGL